MKPTTVPGTTVLGYPRIGPQRELKRATEAYWAGSIDAAELEATAARLRREVWTTLRAAGLGELPSGTFSLYDHVLDTACLVGAIPDRFRTAEGLSGPANGTTRPGDRPDEDAKRRLDRYFAMARGTAEVPPLEMTKWFDTNYHYLVPEIGPHTVFRLAEPAARKPVTEYEEAADLGIQTRPVILGPLSFLLLSKPAAGPSATAGPSAAAGRSTTAGTSSPTAGGKPSPGSTSAGFQPLHLLDALVEVYAELLAALADAGAQWVQIDEPVLAADRTESELDALTRAYARLGGSKHRPNLLVAGYFGPLGAALPRLAGAPIEGLALDLVAGRADLDQIAVAGMADKVLYAGLVDGRNVWRTDLPAALSTAASLLGSVREVVVSSSCSLLHVPLDVEPETGLDQSLRGRLAFARQKVDEIVLLGSALRPAPADGPGMTPSAAPADGPGGAPNSTPGTVQGRVDEAERIRQAGLKHTVDPRVRARLDAIGDGRARRDYAERASLQAGRLGLPLLPTTTIGSFPQTMDVRRARADLRAGRIDQAAYDDRMRDEIRRVIGLQEELGLDVLVHGEPERNDMVQYFAERLRGYASTAHGWVQSYGTRYVRPPILYGDVSRPEPITVDWITYAQSLTSKPVKGILTGPVTMLAWSFVRDDQPPAETARQVALALRDEVHDLESAGIRFIQVDEPALREMLPLRSADQPAYIAWAVAAYRLATSGVSASTQVHSHMCYSEFGEIVDTIDALDADVTSVEAARSAMELVADLEKAGYRRGIGPGVYDIHSPRVPSVEEMATALRQALAAVDPVRLWVNPDCGLKTRDYPEVTAALQNMVRAAREVRAELSR